MFAPHSRLGVCRLSTLGCCLFLGMAGLVRVAAVESNPALFSYRGTKYDARTLMGVTRADYVKDLLRLFSLSDPEALAKESKYLFGVEAPAGQADEIEARLGKFYDNYLQSRVRSLVEELLVDEVGVKAFHYDQSKVDAVIRKDVAYQLALADYHARLSKVKKQEDLLPLIQAFNGKWLAGLSWYEGAKFDQTQVEKVYGPLLGTHALAIRAAMDRLPQRARGWDAEGQDRRWAWAVSFRSRPVRRRRSEAG